MTHRLTILVTSPRVAAGLLTRDAWQVLGSATQILAADAEDPTTHAVTTSGVEVVTTDEQGLPLARRLVERTGAGDVVWVGSPDGDPGLTDALAAELSRLEEPPEVEVLVGSWDVPGARLLDAVAVMDALRSPGGCPWDAEQTHASLAPYLLEEAHETVEAIETEDLSHLEEELGDVLLQVLFHARVAQEHDQEPFDIDDVAAGLVAKLVRRHPHVFGDGDASTPAEVEASWERIKAAEKPDRAHDDLLAGIPASLPLPLVVDKVRARLARRGGDPALDARLLELASRLDTRAGEEWTDLRILLAPPPD
ncbi:MazG family protein [Luteipulveratus flavus]|uniref:MazG family protein n=1 Tax=Luteipulveratus flavus TaxID=3031728 RepID=UPI00319EB684